MTIRTLEQLDDYLSEEIIWRKKELSILRSIIESEKPQKDKQNVLIRSGITVLYAHWEGFIKSASSAYLEFVAMKRLPYSDLTANFIALCIKSKLKTALKSNKASVYAKIAEFFLTGISKKSKIPFKKSIDTKSNLSSKLFKEIVYTLNLDYSCYILKEKLIDKKLLKSRNEIAHGQYLFMNVGDYMELFNEIIILIGTFRNQIINSACTEAYCRSSITSNIEKKDITKGK